MTLRLLAPLAALAAVLATPAVAGAATCDFNAGTVAVSVDGSVVLAVGASGEIEHDGSPCGAATVTNTDLIQVTGQADDDVVWINLADRPFAPGAAPEGDLAEIEFDIDLGSETQGDLLVVLGTDQADVFRLGVNGLDLNDDGDVDVEHVAAEGVRIRAGDDDDLVSAQGGGALGGETTTYLELEGQSGTDELYGGAGGELLDGGLGDGDALFGGGGDDRLRSTLDDGSDDTLDGGDGVDTVDYGLRSPLDQLEVSLDGEANDGVSGEDDNVALDVENVLGGPGNDTIIGSGADNDLRGGDGDDGISGDEGSDLLYGEAGADVLDGGAGSDTFFDLQADGIAPDMFDGGLDGDTVCYCNRVGDLTVTMDGTADDGEAGEGDSVGADVENLTAGLGDDTITGNDAGNIIEGADGNDVLEGGLGFDMLWGFDGDDFLGAGSTPDGADRFEGGPGTDTMDYGARQGSVRITVGALDDDGDVLMGESDRVEGAEILVGGFGDDSIAGDGNANVLTGGDGDDWLRGGGGADVVDGDGGDDELVDGLEAPEADEFHGGDGADTLSYAGRTNGVIVAIGGSAEGENENDVVGNDIENLVGGTGNDQFTGNGSDNTFVGGTGADIFIGLGGTDSVSYAERLSDIVADLDGQLNDDGAAGEFDSILPDIERLVGGSGNDTLSGGSADDELVGGLGADALSGGNGNDTVSYAGHTLPVTADLDGGVGDDGQGLEGDTIGADVENLTGGDGGDVLTGNEGTNVLQGGAGDDALSGGDGGDTLRGDDGNDWLDGDGSNDSAYGGEGDDIWLADAVLDGHDFFNGEAGTDTMSYQARAAGVTVRLDGLAGDGNTAGGENDQDTDVENAVGGSAADSLAGEGHLDNELRGGGGNDTLTGGGAEDVLLGEAGNDTFNEGPTSSGNDTIVGGAGLDKVSYASRGTKVTVRLDGKDNDGAAGETDWVQTSVEIVVGGRAGDLLVGGSAANRLLGGNGNDTLTGSAGADTLEGGAGNDALTGGTGVDRLLGGSGNDRLTSRDNRRDVVNCGTGRVDRLSRDFRDGRTGCESLF